MREQVRVLFVSTSLTGGGAERFASTLLRHLDRARFEPILCLMHPEVTYPLADDVPVHVLDVGGKRTIPRTLWRLRRLLKRERPDTVISSLSYISLFVGEALLWGGLKTRWVARFGAPPGLEVVNWKTWLLARWLRRVYRRADCFVANSHGLARDVARTYPHMAERLCVVYNPTDFAELERRAAEPPACVAEPGVPVVFSAGRLTEQKRPDLLLDAFARLRRRVPAALWLCGDGPLKKRVAADVARRGLGDSVRLLGFCDNPWALMRQATAFALVSDFEGLPNALIEAQGLGLPAVATRCPSGPDEIIEEGTTGYLVPTGDAGAIAERLEELLTDPKRREAMAAAARQRARRLFDSATVVREWEAILAD